jgi:Ser/Thr protein kinase RdoA (MazF antagonist)
MLSRDAKALMLLGYEPEQCVQLTHPGHERNFVFACKNEIIKIYGTLGTSTPENHAKAEQKFSALARERGAAAPAVLRIGTVDGRAYTVSQRLSGASPSQSDANNPDLWRETGRWLGAYHAPTLQDGIPWMDRWLQIGLRSIEDLQNMQKNESDAQIFIDAKAWLVANADPSLFTLLPMGACHNDFAVHNLICQDGHLVGVIDFELASAGNVELDLARLYLDVFSKNPDHVDHFWEGYEENAFITPGFRARLPLYLLGAVHVISPNLLYRYINRIISMR